MVYTDDSVDEYAVQQLKMFDGKKLKVITKKTWTSRYQMSKSGDEQISTKEYFDRMKRLKR